MSNWITCQIGAREHYAIPRAIHHQGKLDCLISDAWVEPNSAFKNLPKTGLDERFHSDLALAKVHGFNLSLISFEIAQKLQKKHGWEHIVNRNQWFQKQAIKKLTQLIPQFTSPPVIFSYSYAALDLFRFAKQQGWYTVLGQIDPGIQEEIIVANECDKYPEYCSNWQPAPPDYWKTWYEECQIADAIVVNSDWSSQLLAKSGIDPSKLKKIPLVYTPPEATNNFTRIYPESFTPERPLRVLFLGQVILRKGIAHVLDSIKSLEGYPIEFLIVGANQIEIPIYFQKHSRIRWIGRVNRSETAKYYQMSDVFLFPTLSDGFGLTQLEAQAWQLPIIASRNCGEVVVDGVNGILLSEVSGEAIAEALRFCLQDIDYLSRCSQQSTILNRFTISHLSENLQNIFVQNKIT